MGVIQRASAHTSSTWRKERMSSLCGKTNLNSAPAFAAHVRAACARKADLVELRPKPVTAPARARGQCTHTKRRLTDCAALNYQDNGRLVAPAWQCAGTHEQGVFPASRLRRIGAR